LRLVRIGGRRAAAVFDRIPERIGCPGSRSADNGVRSAGRETGAFHLATCIAVVLRGLSGINIGVHVLRSLSVSMSQPDPNERAMIESLRSAVETGEGRLVKNGRLLTERELMQMFNVSRRAVRGALDTL